MATDRIGVTDFSSLLKEKYPFPSPRTIQSNSNVNPVGAGKCTEEEGKEKKSLFIAFDDFRGVNATTDFKLPMGGKIPENLTVVASTN